MTLISTSKELDHVLAELKKLDGSYPVGLTDYWHDNDAPWQKVMNVGVLVGMAYEKYVKHGAQGAIYCHRDDRCTYYFVGPARWAVIGHLQSALANAKAQKSQKR